MINQRLLKLSKACQYLDKSTPDFNKTVRPYIPEIKDGRCVKFDIDDLNQWADNFKANNSVQKVSAWQKEHQVYTSVAKSGTSTKLLPVDSFESALVRLNSKMRSGI